MTKLQVIDKEAQLLKALINVKLLSGWYAKWCVRQMLQGRNSISYLNDFFMIFNIISVMRVLIVEDERRLSNIIKKDLSGWLRR